MQCDFEFSRGNGTGVAEALGNWGFSSRISSPGNELQRIKQLFYKMDCLKTPKPTMCVKYNCAYDPEAWYVKPSPDECKPIYTFPMRRPLITYSSTATILLTSNLNSIGTDLVYPIPERSYVLQGTDKWYRRRQDCNARLVKPYPRPCCS